MSGAFVVGPHTIGPGHRPFVVAELSGNHNGDLGRALAIVDAVAETGAQALKLQTYRPDTITIDADSPAFRISDSHGLWSGRSLYELYAEAHTPWEWHEPIFTRARERGLVVFSSPFDETAVDFLQDLDAPIYKIASAELVDLPLIAKVARTGKPMILSTGMATLGEIDAAVTTARGNGAGDLVLLACTSSYPADPRDAHLGSLGTLREAFACTVGLSDHTLGIGVAVAAVALGASVIEKHVTLRGRDGGVDASFSSDPAELQCLVEACKAAQQAMSPARFGPRESEVEVFRLRRSLFVVRDVAAGEKVSSDNVRSIRPSGGLPPGDLPLALGRSFTHAVSRGTPLTWDLL